MSKATWDTQKAKGMWQAGFTDKDIAAEVGTTAASVSYYRRKHWVEDPPQKGALPDAAEECEPGEDTEPDPGTERAKTEGLVSGEGIKEGDDRSMQENRESVRNQRINRFEVMAGAVAGLDGLEAVCVAEAISALWGYTGVDDLLRAKAAIDYLLEQMEE